MERQDILYETLRSLDAKAGDTPPPPPSSPELEPYVVYRNQISIPTIQCDSLETTAPDYFSLDVDEAEDQPNSILTTPLPRHEALQISTPASDRTHESNWFCANSRFRSPMLRLHKEILDFCDFLSPTPEEQESRNTAIQSVFDVIKYIWPTAEADVFGSFKTGLYLPSSDIDVVILGSNISRPQVGLQALSRALSQRGIAKKIQVIAKARVPIIKFIEKRSGVSFDVSFDVDNGPRAAEFIKDAVHKWPPLKPLCLILKVFLQQRELNEVYTGGIGSYALLSMLIAILRNQRDHPEHNLGVLLVKFFDIYGCKLNTVDVGISCNRESIFFPKSTKGFTVAGRPTLIAIEDPQAPDNDIGKNSFNYYQARSAFAMAFTMLTNVKAILRLGPDRSILGSIIRPDAVLLERKGGSTGKVTLDTIFLGTGEPQHQIFDDQQEIHCNWALGGDEDEEPLPRGDGDLKSSEKKRKASKEKKSSNKKVKKRDTHHGAEEDSVRVKEGRKRPWRLSRSRKGGDGSR